MVCNSRVALTPTVTAALVKKGFTVNIESGAGIEARFRNDDYAAAGGKLTDKNTAFKSGNIHLNCCIVEKFRLKKHFCCSDIVLKVRQPLESEIGLLEEHGNIISFLYPALNKPLVSKMAERKLTAFGKKEISIY
jgi:NAD(P) transhydrogenase